MMSEHANRGDNDIPRYDRKKQAIRQLRRIPFWLSFVAVLAVIYDFGFDQSPLIQKELYWVYILALAVGAVSMAGRFFSKKYRPRRRVWPFDGALFMLLSLLAFNYFGWVHIPVLDGHRWLYAAVFLVFTREFSALNINLKKQYFNPAQLFILSFLALIVIGCGLLLLPNATNTGISVIDALFTSTSAVCVTGLIVVDTGSYFTFFGQAIILILIQLGGLGIMTFTSYFSYFFRGGTSYENQLLLKDMTNAEKIAEVFSTLKKIILLTAAVEVIGAALIYASIDSAVIPRVVDRVYFSVFHSVSGFCNAGFSLLSDSLYQSVFRFNYPMHLIIAFLFIIGGIGFPILFNLFKYIRYLFANHILPLSMRRKAIHAPRIFNINTRMVTLTTAILIIAGTVFFFVFEYDNTLAEHDTFGKMVTAFFGGVTPRTAGFNTVDTSALNFTTIVMVIVLMWIGASPASTGGGIKTSTLAIGVLNIVSIATGKDRLELYGREVADTSVKRAFAIILLSLAVIGLAMYGVAYFERELRLLPIAFECFSAYGTVGLSMGITADLSAPAKLIIIITMFIGRVNMLTVMSAVLRRVTTMKYRYPSEDILIN